MESLSANAFSTSAFSAQAFSFGAVPTAQPPIQYGGRSRSRSFVQPHTNRTRRRRDDDLLLMHRL